MNGLTRSALRQRLLDGRPRDDGGGRADRLGEPGDHERHLKPSLRPPAAPGYSARSRARTACSRPATSSQLTIRQNDFTHSAFTLRYCR